MIVVVEVDLYMLANWLQWLQMTLLGLGHLFGPLHLPHSCIKCTSLPCHCHIIDKNKIFNFSTPCPAIVMPLEHFDDEDGMPEKLVPKLPKYYK